MAGKCYFLLAQHVSQCASYGDPLYRIFFKRDFLTYLYRNGFTNREINEAHGDDLNSLWEMFANELKAV